MCVLVVVAGSAAPAAAAPFTALDTATLADQNSGVQFSPGTGVISWLVDNIQQLKLQWFFYRVDGMTQEAPLGDLGFVKGKTSDADFDPGDETLLAVYGSQAGLSVTLTYVLSGGLPGSRQSDLQETIAFHNATGKAVRLQFFQYCDFDLNGTPDDDTVQVLNPNTVSQRDAAVMVAETVVTPSPIRTEVGVFDDTLDKLNNAAADNLDNSKGPLGPADVTWALQWDLTVPAYGTVQISKDKNMVPEPATLGLMGLGLVVAVGSRWRRRMIRRA
jgi:hypothetical protein